MCFSFCLGGAGGGAGGHMLQTTSAMLQTTSAMLMWYIHSSCSYAPAQTHHIHICSCGTSPYAHVVHTHMLPTIGDAADHIVIMYCFMCKCSRPHRACSRPHLRCSCGTYTYALLLCSDPKAPMLRPKCTTYTYAPQSIHICSPEHHHMLQTTSAYGSFLGSILGPFLVSFLGSILGLNFGG